MKWTLSMRYQRTLSALAGIVLGACAAALFFEMWELLAHDGFVRPVLVSFEPVIYGSLCFLGGLLGWIFTRRISKHMQKSVVQISALMGRENALACYETAVKERYRFFSFGDAMMITD